MTSRKRSPGEKEGILEQMLRNLKAIGTNVEEILDKVEAHADRPYDNEWSVNELYGNEEY